MTYLSDLAHSRRLAALIAALWQRRWALAMLFAAVLVPFWGFGELAERVWRHGGFALDVPLLLAIHARASTPLDRLALAISWVGSAPVGLVLVAILCLWLARSGRPGDALFLLCGVGGVCIINVAAKLTFHRMRPALWPQLTPELDYGFPSGHAMLSMAVAVALVILTRHQRWRSLVVITAVCWVLAVGLSRLYLGVHFPSDILAGWCASLVWVAGLETVLAWRRTGKPGPLQS